MKKFFQPWPKDATTFIDKALWFGLLRVVPALFLFMQLIALGFLWQSSSYAGLVKSAPSGAHVFGFLLTVAAVLWVWGVVSDKNFITKSEIGNYVITGILAGLSLWAYTGFQS